MANLLRDRWNQLKKEQKIAIVSLSLCCVFLLLGGISQLNSYVHRPFLVSRQNLARSIQIRTQTFQDETKAMQELKLKDTDRDGISDYDEQYVYRTSAYLGDSDSDGLSDAEEVAKGDDPNCPQGKNCLDVQTSIPRTNTSTLAIEGVTRIPTERPTVQAPQSGVDQFLANPPKPESMNVAETRAYLRSHQLVSEAEIATLPDEAVLQAYQMSYQEALRIQAARAAVAGATQVTASSSASTAPSPAPSPQPTP
jgi:hypothetical protein